jgi:hypothetical protein
MIKLIKSKTKTKLFFKVGYMSDQILNTQLRGFSSISLTHLNATASFLKRKEHKYLLNSKDFASVIKDLKKEYNVLEID